MKRGGLAAIAFASVFLILLASSASAYEYNFSIPSVSDVEGANVQVVSYKYEPYPVEPGEDFELWLKIQNIGGDIARDPRCRIVLDNPFSLYSGDVTTSFGPMGTNEFALATYKIRVDENAIEGENEISIECSQSFNEWKSVKKVKIQIQTRYPTLNIMNIRTVPEFVEPGQKAQLLISLENLADSSMKDIDVKIDFSSVSIAPFGEIGEKKLRRLNANEVSDMIFNIIAMPDAAGGIYKVPLRITYTDELGTAHSMNGTIAVEINSKPELEVSLDSTTISRGNEIGKIVLKIVNKGLTDIKFLTIKILPSKQIKMLSSDSSYIGNVDSDDFETADFQIEAKSSKLVIPVQMEYKDINNKEHSESMNLSYSLLSPAELQGKKSSSWAFFIILILLAALAFWKRRFISEKIKSLKRK